MKYHLYFHDDFDGVSSGAILLNFLKSRGDDYISTTPLGYSPGLMKKWEGFRFKKPFIIVDFRYHPRADWWFDHHLTTFLKPQWQRQFKNDQQHDFDSSAKSCCGQIFRHLKTKYGYRPSVEIAKMVKESDKIDSASYRSAEEAFSEDNIFGLLGATIKQGRDDKGFNEYSSKLIRLLASQDIERIIKMPIVRDKIKTVLADSAKAHQFLLTESKLLPGGIIYNDLSSRKDIRFGNVFPYYVFPNQLFNVFIKKIPKGFHVNIGQNPWKKTKNKIDFSLLAKRYGGGGHKTVGGFETKNHREAIAALDYIVKYIQQHGAKK